MPVFGQQKPLQGRSEQGKMIEKVFEESGTVGLHHKVRRVIRRIKEMMS